MTILNELMDKKKPRILIIRCGLLGDTIDSTAVVKPLIEYYGDDLEIFWVATQGISPVGAERMSPKATNNK